MASRKDWTRGAVTLAMVAVVAGALMAAPVGAAKKGVTKAKARNIATKVFNKNIGGAPFLPTGSVLVQAQDDPTAGYMDDNTGTTTVNTVSITAPTAGFLMISGQVTIDNDDGVPRFFILDMTIDGADATPNGRAAGFDSDTDGDPNDEDSIGYTITRPITAGAHHITQTVTGGDDYDYDGNELSALFVPSGGVARTLRGVSSESSDAGGDA